MNMARHLTSKVHCMASNREMLRFVRSKMKDPRHANREDKKEFYRDCIKEHAENRKLYMDVMYNGI